MASFDIFSQLQGPQINISLFGDAAQAGAAVGRAIPSPVTSAIEGFMGGFERGQEARLRSQQIEANDIALEEAPLRRKEREQRVKANEVAIEQAEQNLKEDQLLNDPRVLQEVNRQYQEYVDLMKGNPQEFVNKVQTGQFDLLFSKDKELGKLTIDRTFGLWDDDKQQAYLAKIREEERAKALDRYGREFGAKFDQIESAYLANDTTKQILSQLPGMDPYTLAQKGSLRQVKEYAPEDLLPDGTPSITAKAPRSKWVFEVDGKTVLDEVPTTFISAWQDYQTAENFRQRRYEGTGGAADLARQAERSKAARDAQQVAASTASNPPPATDVLSRTQQTMTRLRQKYGKSAPPSATPTAPPSASTAPQEASLKPTSFEEGPISALNTAAVKANPILKGVPPIVQAVALTESSGRAEARSPAGAVGIMQVMPGTFNDVVTRYKLKDVDINNPYDNLRVGALYLSEQIKRFGSEPGRIELALAAYNTGPGRVSDALTNASVKSWEGVKEELRKVLKPSAYKEVSEYPGKVLKYFYGDLTTV